MRYYLSMPSAVTLIGMDDGKIQAFIIADRFRPRRASRYMGRIITIDVDPDNQHSGLGTVLLSKAEEELKNAGCDYVSLEVAVNNESALRFYKKHGYVVLKALPNYYLDSIDGLLMGMFASMLVTRTERGDDMFMAMVNRHGHQLLDLEAETLF